MLPTAADTAGVLVVMVELGPRRIGQRAVAFKRVETAVPGADVDCAVGSKRG
jgi:hypothetical protein